MSALAVEDVGVLAGRPKRRLSFARHGVELGLVAVFLLTVATICFQHRIFGADIVIDGDTARNYRYSGYADQVIGGNSTFTSSRPLSWSCDLKSGVPALFCGYEVVFDRGGATRGLDFRTLDAVTFTIDYHGPATTLRFHLKNDDPRYSKHGDRATSKVNKVEFSVHDGRQTLAFHANELSVADWWLSGKHFAPELGRTQLDNVVAAEIASGTIPPAGRYSFALQSLTFKRSSVAPAQLYLIILAIWAVLIGLYMIIRMQRARNDALEKEHAQAEARAALASAKQAAEQANKAKSDFLTSMSHELRTPLNAVLGYAQLLERSDLSEKHLSAVRTIHRSGDYLLSLITDVLDLSKIEAGKMELHCAPTSVRGALAAAVEMIGVRAEEAGLAFSCVIDDDVPEAIEADEKRLRQILLNLLSNAVKFTAEGRVSLLVSLLDRAGDTATIRFEVRDSGAGIAEDELERIFRPFEQVGEIRQREGGTGLGLTISRQLAALMGSTIEVDSRVGQGTSFWLDVCFPVAEAPDDGVLSSADIRGYAGPRRRVLVVDDHPANRELLCDLLQPLGFETAVACDGREAVEAARRVAPDLILMDLKMPVMDGTEAIRLIRLIEPLKLVPILAVSANIAEEADASSRAAGANGFVSKPIDNGGLLGAVGRVLNLEWITAAAAPAVAPRQDRPERVAPAERSLRILAAEDNPTNQQLLRAVLLGLDVELQLVANGAEAVGAFQDRGFDLVLMDVEMPEMGGLEAARAIRRCERKSGRPRTPIIALSANDAADRLADYRAADMDGHLDKPIAIEQLYRLLEEVATGSPPRLQLAR